MRVVAVALLVGAGLLAVAIPAAARVTATETKTDDGCCDFVQVQARVLRPRSLAVSIVAPDDVRRKVTWHVVCQRGDRLGERVSNPFYLRGSARRRFPLPMRRPGACTYTASTDIHGRTGVDVTLRLHAYGGRDAPGYPADGMGGG